MYSSSPLFKRSSSLWLEQLFQLCSILLTALASVLRIEFLSVWWWYVVTECDMLPGSNKFISFRKPSPSTILKGSISISMNLQIPWVIVSARGGRMGEWYLPTAPDNNLIGWRIRRSNLWNTQTCRWPSRPLAFNFFYFLCCPRLVKCLTAATQRNSLHSKSHTTQNNLH